MTEAMATQHGIRFLHDGAVGFGTLAGEAIQVFDLDLFTHPRATSATLRPASRCAAALLSLQVRRLHPRNSLGHASVANAVCFDDLLDRADHTLSHARVAGHLLSV